MLAYLCPHFSRIHILYKAGFMDRQSVSLVPQELGLQKTLLLDSSAVAMLRFLIIVKQGALISFSTGPHTLNDRFLSMHRSALRVDESLRTNLGGYTSFPWYKRYPHLCLAIPPFWLRLSEWFL